ncbi:hypothetical protein COCNU_08G002050 [Cocos nucifera]|uniref:Uncharacterized protein n=1 Tax=Cocos nucifera TaxID=13894 RepID=A0A8K0IGY2_COCNU|nr:hypothetical protein COCNU_08G002050 [Cocos nucifera]
MDRDTDFIPSSPTNSSPSSSDLDTESTGSFFHDRSTTLGTLMGVSFREIAIQPARVLSRRDHGIDGGGGGVGGGEGGGRRLQQSGVPERRRRRGHRGGRSWWRLCGDNMVGATSLGDFLQVERRLDGGGDVADGRFLYGGGGGVTEHEALGGGPLFEDGRVLPPAEGRRRRRQRAAEGGPPRWGTSSRWSGGWTGAATWRTAASSMAVEGE